ncbi:unnamed protein product [Gongylonema pulchrum]|uniref:Glucosidase II subunit alpha n=1 Tax=Gongylonema pulchrum TaxID=637853 RepID=A0A183E9A8_9BILA|nr:unnamed protein product [Gongylonema pulchrum]
MCKVCRNTDPYRLYNLDVFEYELNEPMSLYGAVPFLVTHNKEHSLGMLWLNAAETWVDIASSTADKGILRSIVEKIKSSTEVPQIDVHFMSESGLIDLFLMLGPRPNDIFRQNSALTGVYPLPPLFSLAYHQSRWNYNDEEDVQEVHEAFDKHDIPVDVIWLDIEHTDGKRYFTWDQHKFPKPKEMIDKVSAKKRDGEDYEGHCWPGASMYLDFLNPEVRDFWASKFAFDQYAGSTEDLFTWNDMNEPSVFSGPEVTMHKDAKHFGDWEHRDVHNIYGFYHHSASYRGLLARTNERRRPFILTRSFFVGSQRTAAVWTGDNTASWEHLKITVPMLLSLSVAGIPHHSASYRGLLARTNERRRPFILTRSFFVGSQRTAAVWTGDNTASWEHLKITVPMLLSLSVAGIPHVGADIGGYFGAFDEEREWLVGAGLLVRPIMDPDVKSVSLYLPGVRNVIWYEWSDHKGRIAPGAVYVDAPLDAIPLFQRGGTIIPTWERVRRASTLMRQDPITLYIAINLKGDFSNGTIYMDDGETFDYQNGQYLYWGFIYKKEGDQLYSISSKNLDRRGKLQNNIYIEKIVVRGVRYYPTNVHIYLDGNVYALAKLIRFEDYELIPSGSFWYERRLAATNIYPFSMEGYPKNLLHLIMYAFVSDWNPETADYTHDRDAQTLIIRKPGVLLTREFRIDIHA